MRARLLPFVVVTAAFAFALPAGAAPRLLCSDSLNRGGAANFQGGFAIDEEAAIRVTGAPAASTLVGVQLLFGGSDNGDGRTEGLRVYDASGADALQIDDSGWPGLVLYDGDAPLISSDQEASEVNLDAPLTLDGSPFWVSIVMRTGGFPNVSTDGDGFSGTSAIFGNLGFGLGWYDAEGAGLSGDFIIRAVIDTDAPLDDTACRFGAGAGSGEGEGDVVVGEGEGDVVGEGEGDVVAEGEGDVVAEGEGDSADLFISSITPSSAAFGESVDVVILGGGFGGDVSVRVGSEDAEAVVVDNATTIRAKSPAGLAVGSYDVIAQAGADVFVFPSGFTVTPVDVAEGEGDTNVDGGCAAADAGSVGGAALVGLVLVRRRLRSMRN